MFSVQYAVFDRLSSVALISVVVTLIVVGILLWLVNTHIPMDGTIKQILNIVVIIVVVLWLLQVFGILVGLGGFRLR